MNDLYELMEPVVTSMGYELVGVEYTGGSGNGILRVFIDNEAGILLDDCAAVSHQISALLDVEEPISEGYNLEVSSPGLERPLFKLTDFERFVGKTAKVKLNIGVNGRRNFRGELVAVTESKLIEIEVDGEIFELPYADVAKANLVTLN